MAILLGIKLGLLLKAFTNSQLLIFFHETFSPVINLITVRTVLNITLHHLWGLRQLDVNNIFLKEHLTKEVYMAQPQGMCNVEYAHHVCRLRKAIYGLKQVPQAWYLELCTFLLSLGFVTSLADSYLFVIPMTPHLSTSWSMLMI